MPRPPSHPLVADLVQRLDVNCLEDFEERAAIMEHDGLLPRPQAECLALLDVLRRHPYALIGVTTLIGQRQGESIYVITSNSMRTKAALQERGYVCSNHFDSAVVLTRHFKGHARLHDL